MNDPNFRLPKSIRPTRYMLHINADLEAWRFDVREEIELSLDEPAAKITLHAVELDIRTVEAEIGDRRISGTSDTHPLSETVTLSFPEAIPAGDARLRLELGGDIRARLRGFYRSTKDGRRYAATQFEAADARRAFVCFDEPEFKARFALLLNIPSGLTAISNGTIVEERDIGDGRREVRFAETPPISSYLVAYTVGPYEATPLVHTETEVPVRVFLPQGMAAKGIYARDAHRRSLEYLERYTAIPYPYGKVDAIGVPDFEAGAMENPGAITYRLTAIAADEQRASTQALKGIFYTAAHELTHMWWGDLVTMAWWDDLWLNESFATFVGYKVVADLVPEWDLWRDFVSTLTRPFNLDALLSTHPISFEVKNAKQATERFDVITYWKGAGVVRMLEGFLGAVTFRDGVRAYLNRYRESNATADDFWRELSEVSGRDVGKIANAWIRLAGHPLVHATAETTNDGLRISLRQERFLADPQAKPPEETRWPVPLVIRYGTGSETREQRFLLEGESDTVDLPGARWFFPNGDGAGFYRFAMDDESARALAEAVARELSPQERLTLIGNQWALTKAGKADLGQLFTMLRGFGEEEDRAVLGAIAERLAWLDSHVVDEQTRPAFARTVRDLFAPQYRRLGWEPATGETADQRLRRAIVIGVMGDLAADAEARAEAHARLQRYLRDPSSLDPNLTGVVVDLAARGADCDLYETYLGHKRSAGDDPEEEQRFLYGLTGFEEPELIRRTLELSLGEEVRAQDRAHFLARLLGRRASKPLAWAHVRRHWDSLVQGMDPMLQQNLVRALTQLTDEPAADEVRAFLPAKVTDETRETAAQALEQLGIDVVARRRMRGELEAALAIVTQ